MKKIKVKMNEPIYLGMPILDIGKTLMYESWQDYIQPKSKYKPKLCNMDTDSFVINIFTKGFLKTLTMMLKDVLIHITMMKMMKDHL